MGGDRHTSRRLEATKDCFFGINYADSYSYSHAWGGGLIESDDEDVFIIGYLPWDFYKLVEAVLLIIPNATLTPMTMRIYVNWSEAGRGCFDGANTIDKNVNTVLDRLTEVSFTEVFYAGELSPGEYIGINPRRVAGQNIDAIILGARLKYNIPTYARAV